MKLGSQAWGAAADCTPPARPPPQKLPSSSAQGLEEMETPGGRRRGRCRAGGREASKLGLRSGSGWLGTPRSPTDGLARLYNK